MAMTAGDIIDEARDYNPAFRSRVSAGKSLVRRLSRIQQRLATRIAASEEAAVISIEGTIPNAVIVAAMAADGIVTIAPYLTTIEMRAVLIETQGPGEVPVFQTNRVNQYQPRGRFPSVVLSNDAVRLTDLRRVGNDLHGWEDYEEIIYDYIPFPVNLVDEDSVLTVPDGLAGVLVASMAEWMALRLNMSDVRNELRSLRIEEMGDFMDTVLLQPRGGSWHVTDGTTG